MLIVGFVRKSNMSGHSTNLSKHGVPMTPESLGNSRDWGDANDHVKFGVQKEIIQQATKARLPQHDIANLLALAEVESGFNPDAATTSRISSASGVFAITDETAKDTKNRLSGTQKIDGFTVNGNYDRFKPESNVSYGIATYLDKKKHAHSENIGTIYEKWNTNADETAKYKDRLQQHAKQYEKDLKNKVWDGPGPPAPEKSVVFLKPEPAGSTAFEKMSPVPKMSIPAFDQRECLNMPDTPSSRLLQSVKEPPKVSPDKLGLK
ncbi:transglycosylase SLT domain-containing protein [Undibacterium sp. YM2]|uniref:transglycosylase SLT domain-containing protein n=1 Tax=Undibacterium sp. YM2 TaxID=2058625 RepID=UPI001389A4B4|nr:transglycosylase SLT domain-containing protein [Undibacterium sp. YM2]